MVHLDHYRNGKKLVSVTELTQVIAKPFLEKWRLKLCHCKTHAVAEKKPFKPAEKAAIERHGLGHCGAVYADQVKDDAGDLGTAVHEIIEVWFKTGDLKPHFSDEAMLWARKITEVYKAHDVKPSLIKPEGTLIDEESMLAGSPDTIAFWEGRIEILDTKIKNSLDTLTAYQGCGYRYLLNRKLGVDVRYMRPIWCAKETVGKLVKTDLVYDLDEWTDDWKGLIRQWNRINPTRKVTLLG